MKRIRFGLAVVFVLGAIGAKWYASSGQIIFPKGFTYDAVVQSTDNLYDPSSQSFKGQQRSQTLFHFTDTSRDGEVANIVNNFTVRDSGGNTIVSLERNYGVNTRSGKHQAGAGDRDRDGYFFGPRNASKTSYKYWHINYDQAIDLHYQNEETIYGVRLYHYSSKFTSDQTKELSHLPGVGVTKGMSLEVDIDLWIEPTTGWLVKYNDSATATYYDLSTGDRLEPWNNFSNSFSDESANEQAIKAKQLKTQLQFVDELLPFSLLLLAVCLIFLPYLGKLLRSQVMPWLVLAIFLALTAVSVESSITSGNESARAEFEQKSKQISEAITEKIARYEVVLRGGEGLFTASADVTKKEWSDYINSLEIDSLLPGVQGVGFSQKLGTAAEKDLALEAIKADDQPDFRLTPEGEREEYHAIVFLYPQNERNARAIGFDMFQEATRRRAMEEARDKNEPTVSGKVTLVQENNQDVQNGFLMYMPVYRNDLPKNTQAERREALIGYVYSPFRARDFIESIFGSGSNQSLSFKLYDQVNTDAAILYESNKAKSRDAKFSRELTLDLPGGRTWVLTVDSSEAFEASINNTPALRIALRGIVLSLSAFGLLFVLFNANSRAQKIALRMTRDLRINEEEALKAAQASQEAEEKATKVAAELEHQNKLLEDTKRAVLNILEDLHEEKAKAETEKTKYAAILNSIGEGLIVIDDKGIITEVNPTAGELLGEKTENFFNKWYPKEVILVDSKGEPVIASQRPEIETMLTGLPVEESGYYFAHGEHKLPVAITASPYLIDDHPVGVIIVFKDITRERELDQAKDDFIALASHQLRTPATAIKQFVGMILEGYAGKITAEQKDLLHQAYLSNERQIHITQDMLNVARLESGTLDLQPELIDTADLINSAIEEQKFVIESRKQTIKVVTEPNLFIEADRNLMRMLVDNFVSNASKYTPEGGKIEVICSGSTGDVKIVVSDTGVGISKKDQKQLFGRFSRIQNSLSTKVGGSGLGLYIAKKIVNLHNGKIELESAEGKGATFTITLRKAKNKKPKT